MRESLTNVKNKLCFTHKQFTMTILYDWFENPKSDDTQETTLHVRPCFNGKVTTHKLIEHIQQHSSLTPGDVLAVLSELSHTVGEYLSEGCQVHVEGLGYFSPTLAVEGKVTPDMPLRDRNRKVRFKDISFRMDKGLKQSVGHPKTEMTRWETHSAKLSEEEMETKLAAYFQENGFITRLSLQYLLGLKKSAALSLLKQLRESGRLLNKGTNHSPVYVPAPGCFSTPTAP